MSKYFPKYLLKFISVVIITFCDLAFAQSEIPKQVKNGLEHCYNFEWASAQNIFSGLVKKYPDDPNGYHYQSEIFLWHYLGTKSEEDLKSFTQFSDLTIQKCEAMLDKNSDDSEVLYLLGMNYTFRAIAFTQAESYLDAAMAAKNSESNLSRCIELNKNNYDAYFGLGLYNFAVAQIPKAFSWVLSIAGFNGDEETGFRFLKLASEKGSIARIEAKYFYSQLLSEVVADYKTAHYYLTDLSKKYPANLLFNYSLASNLIKQKKPSEAKIILNRILSSNDKKFVQLISFSNFLLGDVYFKLNEFKEAVKYYDAFITSTRDNDYKGIAYYRAAICLELFGNHQDAVIRFSKSGQGNMDLDDDIYAKRRGKIFSSRKVGSSELHLLKLSNLIEQGKLKIAIDSLELFLRELENTDLKSETYYHIANANYESGKFNDAITNAVKSLNTDCGDESWIHPFAAYIAAQCYIRLGKFEQAENYIDKANDFSDYDYKNKLENLLKTAEKEANK